ncbi:MAG: hypothetical protein MUP22_12125 [Desulfobacterales bacterium]|nr:hypothetical protein [Desulfobacterales bacterium]
MELNEAVEFCNKWLSSWTGNKPDELIKFYSINAFYSDPAVPDGLTGHDQIQPYFNKLLAANPAWEWKHQEIFLTEKGFTLKWKATIPVGGTAITEFGLDIVEITNAAITRNEVYFDRTKLITALRKSKE